jgi:VanZ family protein
LDVVTAVEVVLWIVFAVFALRGARWAYAIFVLLGFLWIPARTGFHLHRPPCHLELNLDLALYSMRKYKHIVLFGMFFLMTYAQMPRARYALLWAALATMAMGALIELEEGATGTGTCNVRDLVPDAAGVLIGGAVATIAWRRR